MSHRPEVTVEELEHAMAQGAQVVDVREPAEYADGHVAGTLHVPMGRLADRVGEVDRDRPVLVLCRSGNRSGAMTDLLRHHGVDAHNVSGGVQAWVESGRALVAGAPNAPVVVPIDTPTLGNRSYLVHDGEVALVVDPQRDVDRVEALLREAGVRLTDVFETHVHNDYLTGGVALARRTGARLHVNAADPVSYERTPIRDGDVVRVGSMRVRALATPGHTFTHLSYALAAGGEDLGVFTGGSLLHGATGRPDLLGPEHTDALVRHQHRSAHRISAELPGHASLYPTHGFGSFCSAGTSSGDASTVADERRGNPALTLDEDRYVADLLAGLQEFPAYYAHMGPANLDGPVEPDLSPPARADAADVDRRITAGEWVVDLRDRTAYAGRHVVGSLNLGLDGQLATYAGWLLPWGAPLTLLGETPEQVAEAQRELSRIGFDRPAAAATGDPADWTERELGSFPRADFADLREAMSHRPLVVLDVRRAGERAESHVDGSVHVPLHELLQRVDDVPAGQVWVHCAGGYRASIAASVLVAAGRDVVAVDDGFDRAAEVGLPLVGVAS